MNNQSVEPNVIAPVVQPSKTKWPKRRKIIIISTLIAVVVAMIIVGLLISGLVYVGTKKPAQKIQLVYQVCDNDVIDEYNQIQAQKPETDMENQKYEEDFNKLVNEIQSAENADKDPTCQYILFSNYQRQGDVDNMRRAAGLILEMNEDGCYINSKIDIELYSISTLQSIIETAN